ncbi:MAG: threonine synthase [Gemmatimonadota bacterium]
MNSFISTRRGARSSLADALSQGLAPDGGLFVPTYDGSFPPPPREPDPTFADTAQWAAPTLMPGVARSLLEASIDEAFDFPIPLVEVEPDLWVLELFHGPTHAFKDVGARFMARLMARLLPRDGERTVLVATSGDTGGAVAAAFHGVPGYRVAVLFPKEGVSERQRRQMTTLGGNVTALSVSGTFDDCQRLAKEAFMDRALSERFRWTSANSINVGRLLPQAFYYLHAARLLGWAERRATFIVPCGNLGNLCAGLLAHRFGMPASGFLAATNVNRAFVDFLEGGAYQPRPSVHTASNAMDVGDPSNLERILWMYEGDVERIRQDVRAASVSDEVTARTIGSVYERTGYVLDPHTAVAYHVAETEPGRRSSETPMVVLSTAHPAKFPDIVERATGRNVSLPPGLARAMDKDEHMIDIEPRLGALAGALDSARGTA